MSILLCIQHLGWALEEPYLSDGFHCQALHALGHRRLRNTIFESQCLCALNAAWLSAMQYPAVRWALFLPELPDSC